VKAHLTGNARWIPQRAVEEEFEKSNPFVFSLNYLWYYPCFAVFAGIIVSNLIPDGIFIMWMLGTLFTLQLQVSRLCAHQKEARSMMMIQ